MGQPQGSLLRALLNHATVQPEPWKTAGSGFSRRVCYRAQTTFLLCPQVEAERAEDGHGPEEVARGGCFNYRGVGADGGHPGRVRRAGGCLQNKDTEERVQPHLGGIVSSFMAEHGLSS